MRKIFCLFGIAMIASIMLTGCESDSTPDSMTFRNDSSYEVRVTFDEPIRLTINLAPNGGETSQLKTFAENYTYVPTATVSDRRDGSKVFFENRFQ